MFTFWVSTARHPLQASTNMCPVPQLPAVEPRGVSIYMAHFGLWYVMQAAAAGHGGIVGLQSRSVGRGPC